MRFKKMKKKKVISFSFCITKSYVGNGYAAPPLSEIKGRAITSKVEEMTGFRKPGQSLSPKLTLALQNAAQTDAAGALKKALERNLFSVRHDRALPLLDLTPCEVLGYPCHVNKPRIPRRWKCSRRVC
jgi:hypothetical protein